jgi:hypothetical protein
MNANLRPLIRSPFISMRRARLKNCPVCGGSDNCSIREDRSQLFCRREAGASWPGSKSGAGGYTCTLDDSAPCPPIFTTRKPAVTPATVADENIRHAVYTAFLRSLSLSPAHHADLARRGLSSEVIKECLFRSAPTNEDAAEITHLLAQDCDLSGVAGFFKERGRWRTVWMDESILIPVRDQHAHIIALMRRRTQMRPGEKGKYIWFASGEDKDGNPREGGVSSGSPCHFANSHLLREAHDVTITEGPLKAQIASYFLNQPVIGNSPSGYGANFAATLKANFPQLRTVFCAFDSDLSINIHVRNALFRLVEQLEKAGFDVRVRRWPPQWKGIDDYLLAVASQKEVAA